MIFHPVLWSHVAWLLQAHWRSSSINLFAVVFFLICINMLTSVRFLSLVTKLTRQTTGQFHSCPLPPRFWRRLSTSRWQTFSRTTLTILQFHVNSSRIVPTTVACENALPLCIDKWNWAVDSGQQCGVVFADMSKAFDRVKHSLLSKELAEVGLGGTVLDWFSDYLSRRSQRVVFDDVKGSIRSCTRGVPQGSVLGPLLFSIYIRHVTSIFTHSVSQLYADDIAFYNIGRHIPAIMQQLQADLSALALHLDERGLVLNPTKTQFLLLRRPNTPGTDEEAYVTCKGSTIIPASTVKYLGILVDEHLTFRPQVERVCSAVLYYICALFFVLPWVYFCMHVRIHACFLYVYSTRIPHVYSPCCA